MPRLSSRLRFAAVAGTIAKLLFAGTVFAATVGGYAYVERRQLLRTPLPETSGPSGRCAMWFVGSSSIHRWSTLASDMVPWRTRNRAVNGVLLDEITARFASDTSRDAPAVLVIYAGENDIAGGASPDAAATALIALVDRAIARWPGTVVLAAGLKPSPTRWSMRPAQLRFDADVRRAIAARPHARYLAIGSELLAGDRPGPYYQEDGVHLNAAGYARWGGAMRAAIDAALPPGRRAADCASGR